MRWMPLQDIKTKYERTSDGSGLGMLPRLRKLKTRYDEEDAAG